MNSSSAIYTDQAALNPGATFALSQSKVSCTSELLSELRLALGTDHVHTDFPNLLCYSRDRLPWATFQVRRGKVPGALPEASVSPANHDEVCTVLRLANLHGVPVIAFGAGSGVLGGTLPLGGEIMLDLKRLNQIIGWHEEDGMVDVRPLSPVDAYVHCRWVGSLPWRWPRVNQIRQDRTFDSRYAGRACRR